MRIAGINKCSLNNGEGVRFVVFLQGCAHHCPGCHNPETWDFDGGYEIAPEEIATQYNQHPFLDGITLSGGDPYYQQEECCKLLDLLPGVNVWVYTGFEWEDIRDFELTERADAIVTGAYIAELKCEGKMYGSGNQEIHRRVE